MSTDTDVELIERYRGGDISGFDELFRRYHPRVRATCMRAVGDAESAEDLVQETFYKVLRAVARVDCEQNIGAWIHRIALNLCHDEIRRRRRRAARQVGAGDPQEALLHLADTDPTTQPDAALEMAGLRQLVWTVSKRLPERQRTVLTLRELQGLSYSSIARVMGISDAAVETLLHRARTRFRREFLLLDIPAQPATACLKPPATPRVA